MDSKQSPKTSSGDFNSFLAQVELINLRTVKLNVRAEKEFQHKQVKDINVKVDSTYANHEGGSGFSVDVAYVVRLRGGRRVLGSAAVTLRLFYSSPLPMTDSLFKIFGKQPAQFQTWPFLRQHLADISTRCNWPRLTLPLLHIQTFDQESTPQPKK